MSTEGTGKAKTMQTTNNLSNEARETLCSICHEALGVEAVADNFIYKLGELDSIELMHETCLPSPGTATRPESVIEMARHEHGPTCPVSCWGPTAQPCRICNEPMDAGRSGTHTACREEMEAVDDQILNNAR